MSAADREERVPAGNSTTETGALTGRSGGTTDPTIALALGGGGARGIAHILMLEAFDELGVKPALITGTSIGAIYGAAYASGLSGRLLRAHTEETLSQRLDFVRQLISARADPVQRLFNLLPLRSALLNPVALLEFVLPSAVPLDFAQLTIPFSAVATDFYAQEAAVISTGALRPAIAASMALPAIFQPVAIEGRAMVDGGLVNPLPFDVVMGRADVTVAIDVSGATHPVGTAASPRAFEAIFASTQILQRSIVREKLKSVQPDIYIDVAVDRFRVLDFHLFRDVMAASIPAKEHLKRELARLLGRPEPREELAAESPPAMAHLIHDAAQPRLEKEKKRRKLRPPSLRRSKRGS
jgi:NTE family protein